MLVEQLPILNLSVMDFRDSSLLGIVDNSSYQTIPDASNVALQIAVPGYNVVNVSFTPGALNTYRCLDLGVNCTEDCTPLPDGIYNLIYTVTTTFNGQPTQTTMDKNVVKVDQIKCRWNHLFLKIDLACGCHTKEYKDNLEYLEKIQLYIMGCVGEANANNNLLSNEYYQKASLMLSNLDNKFKGINPYTYKTC